ncbi:hypothetical protein [Rodentibacter rarus]|nr:hypothetical protein [Rodentibacter rarus]
MQCVLHLLEITANIDDTLSYQQLAGLIGVFVVVLDWHAEEMQGLLNLTE